ncbi:hypothetical protein BaOVIS_024900 [Babesia ovis]|uniref:Uncharacterized protein n=1 Tax=Babesia ovis TaxID=5869 RepID=A0A9W5TCY8_BABOV|nr:hypothetical protein BaOVIS_024900 [Babesia ovis]
MITTLGCGENRYLDIVEGLYGYGWHNGKEIKPMNVINDVKKRCQYQRDCSFNSMTLKKNVYKGEGNYFRTIFKCKPVTDKCYQINCGLNAHCITEDDSVMCRCDPGSIRENDKCVDTAVYEDYRHRPIKLARFKIPKQDDEEHDIMYEPHDHRANTLYEPEFGKIDKESGVLIVDRDDPELIDDDEDIVADKPVSGGTHNDENHPPHMHALTVDKTGVVIINPETMNNPTEQEGKKDTKQDGNNDTEQGSFTSNKISSENSSPDISHSADSVRNNVDENNRKIDADKKTSEVTPENTVSTSEDIVKEMGTTNGETGGQTVNNDPHVEEVQTTSEDNTPHGAMGNNIPKPHIPITPEDTTSLPPDIDKGLLHPSGGAINTTNHTSPLNSNQPSKDSANRESESGTANTDIKRRLVVPLENIDELGKNMQNRENAFGHQTLIGPHAQDGIESKRNKLQHPNKKSGILLIDNDTTANAGDTFQSSVPKMGYCNGADTNKDCYTNRGNVNLSNGRVPILKNTDDSPTLPRPKLMGNTKMAHIMQHRENSSIYATPHTTVEYANQQTDSFICYIPTLFVASQPHSTDGRIEFETKQDDNNVRIYRYRYCISN